METTWIHLIQRVHTRYVLVTYSLPSGNVYSSARASEPKKEKRNVKTLRRPVIHVIQEEESGEKRQQTNEKKISKITKNLVRFLVIASARTMHTTV